MKWKLSMSTTENIVGPGVRESARERGRGGGGRLREGEEKLLCSVAAETYVLIQRVCL